MRFEASRATQRQHLMPCLCRRSHDDIHQSKKKILTRRPHQPSLRDMKLHRLWWTHSNGFPFIIIIIVGIAPDPSRHLLRFASRGTNRRTRLSSTCRRQYANAGNPPRPRWRVKNLGGEFWRCDRGGRVEIVIFFAPTSPLDRTGSRRGFRCGLCTVREWTSCGMRGCL